MLKGLETLVKGLLLSIPVLVSSQNELKAADPPVPNQYGAIYENDGVASTNIQGKLDWVYKVQNSNYGNITSVKFVSVYSTSPPIATSKPDDAWILSTIQVSSNKWDVTFSTTDSAFYIFDGGLENFGIRTTYNTNSVVNVGNRDGAVKFELGGGIWYTPNISQLVGPTGVSWPVNLSAGAYGTVTPTGQINVAEGTSTNLTATANPGYRLCTIVKDGSLVFTNSAGDNLITSTNLNYGPVTNQGTVSFTFEPKTFTLTALGGQDGSLTNIGSPTPNVINNITNGGSASVSFTTIVTNQLSPNVRYKYSGFTRE